MEECNITLTDEDRHIIAERKMPHLWERDTSAKLRNRIGHAQGMVRVLCCKECGGENIHLDGYACWNAKKERFELLDIMEDEKSISVYCGDCQTDGLNSEWIWRKRTELLLACPDCGCTDIRGTAWVDVNTFDALDGDPPTSELYCPECSESGFDGIFKGPVATDEKRPYGRLAARAGLTLNEGL